MKPKLEKSVLYSDHDSKLQRQIIDGNGKLLFVQIWRAICDERPGSMKTVVVFAFTKHNPGQGLRFMFRPSRP